MVGRVDCQPYLSGVGTYHDVFLLWLSFFSVLTLPLANWSPKKNEEKGREEFSTDGITSRNTFDSIKLNKHLLNIVTGLNASARIKKSTAWPLSISFFLDRETSAIAITVKSAVIFFSDCNRRLPFNIKILAAQWDTGMYSAELQSQKY